MCAPKAITVASDGTQATTGGSPRSAADHVTAGAGIAGLSGPVQSGHVRATETGYVTTYAAADGERLTHAVDHTRWTSSVTDTLYPADSDEPRARVAARHDRGTGVVTVDASYIMPARRDGGEAAAVADPVSSVGLAGDLDTASGRYALVVTVRCRDGRNVIAEGSGALTAPDAQGWMRATATADGGADDGGDGPSFVSLAVRLDGDVPVVSVESAGFPLPAGVVGNPAAVPVDSGDGSDRGGAPDRGCAAA